MVCPFRYNEEPATSKEPILVFCCDICSFQNPHKGDISKTPFCRCQFLKLLPYIEINTQSKFITDTQTIWISAEKMVLFKEYADLLFNFDESLRKGFQDFPELEDILYYDPVRFLEYFRASKISQRARNLHAFFQAFKRTRLFKLVDTLSRSLPNTSSLFYEELLEIQRIPRNPPNKVISQNLSQILHTYQVGPFKIEIIRPDEKSLENYYQVVVDLGSSLSTQIARSLVSTQMSSWKDAKLQTLEELLDTEIANFERHLSINYNELDETIQKNLAIYATAQMLNITKSMPLLLDDEVQEFYLDKPGNAFYLDHTQWGRCCTNLTPTQSEINHLITRLRLESRRPLDERTPSLKTELKTKFFHVRAAIDIPPLSHYGAHLNIRKIRLRVLTLPELIKNGSISLAAAAFLLLCMSLRINITIGGEPSTGKTTLANAINLLAPPHWRRITIEDALESISVDEIGRHKVTFKVDPFDSLEESHHTKSNEIIRLLHRSPDWVFLGEIQTAEHSAAMFHALSAGIKGIQTCHASSNYELLQRWQIHHNIPEVCFRSLGLLVHMVKELSYNRILRKVAQICEITFDDGKPTLCPLFEWNKSTKQLEQKHPDNITELISHACRFQQITNKELRFRYNSFKQALNNLITNHVFDPIKIVLFFDELYATIFSQERENQKDLRKKFRGDNFRLLQTIRQNR